MVGHALGGDPPYQRGRRLLPPYAARLVAARPEIAIFPEKSEILLLILVKILKKSDSTHSSSKGAVNAYFLTGSFSKKTWLFEAVVFLG